LESREIPGYQGRYAISEDGTVISTGVPRIQNGRWGDAHVSHPPRPLRPALAGNGYWFVGLYRRDDGRRAVNGYLHRLVAEAFLPNPDGLPEVNHKDGDKSNNAVSNLEWMTSSQNRFHRSRVLGKCTREAHGRAKLTEADVLHIRSCSDRGVDLAKHYGVSKSLISAIRNNKIWVNHV
jgi:hypothetical protein